jgi:SAM-dependent methyltransferase
MLSQWLPKSGLVLEIASGTGEHAVYFAERFANLEWQPSDMDPSAIESIRAWRAEAKLPNLREPVAIDVANPHWPVDRADAIINSNMIHISPWIAALGLLDGAERLLGPGSPLILYGPWISAEIETAPSNLAFDSDLRSRDPRWGLRNVENFAAEAEKRGFVLADRHSMPANNLMLLFQKGTEARGF